MLSVCWAFLKQGALTVRIIWLLLLTVFVFFGFGFYGAYEDVFGGINVSQNTTLALQHAWTVVHDAYETGTPPSSFVFWGMGASIVYVLVIVVYYILSCLGIFHTCSRRLEGYSETLLERERKGAQAIRENDLDVRERNLDELRVEMNDFLFTQTKRPTDVPMR